VAFVYAGRSAASESAIAFASAATRISCVKRGAARSSVNSATGVRFVSMMRPVSAPLASRSIVTVDDGDAMFASMPHAASAAELSTCT